jgi:FtsZ-binding cell division protein ZapB
MSDLLSRLESRIRQAVEKIEEYQLEIDDLKKTNIALEAERQEMHDKLALLIDSFEELEAATEAGVDSSEIGKDAEENVEVAAEEVEVAAEEESKEDDDKEVDVSHHNSHNSVNSYATSPW